MAQGSLIAGRYRLERHLGEGGMGTVWAATHVVTRRAVAMKFLRTEIQHKLDVRQRFLREAQAVSALRHPNVVEVIDVFDLPDRSPVIVMELLDGETLAEKLIRDERLSTEETAAIMLPVIAAVGSAHAMGIIHRDLKPENIFLARTKEGVLVKVLDFGIAKVTRELCEQESQAGLVTEEGTLLGTPCYMAPEQITNTNVDNRADIWSLGVILYECLSGTRPVEGQNTAEVVARVLSEAITPLERLAPELPHEVTGLVRQMLSRDPKRRPQDLGELTKVLERYTHGHAPTFDPPRKLSANAPDAYAASVRVSVDPPQASTGNPASIRRTTTMRSAPAVGIDGAMIGTGGTPGRAPGPVSRPRVVLSVVLLLAFGLVLMLISALQRSAAVTAGPTVPSQKASGTGTVPETPSSHPIGQPIPTVAELPAPPPPGSSGVASPGSGSHRQLVGPTPKPVVRVDPSKHSSAQSNEDTLFSGRK